jgi:hypothetical protein
MTDDLKQCSARSGCGQWKSRSEFGMNKSRKDGLSDKCRQCCRERKNKYRAENPEYRQTIFSDVLARLKKEITVEIRRP